MGGLKPIREGRGAMIGHKLALSLCSHGRIGTFKNPQNKSSLHPRGASLLARNAELTGFGRMGSLANPTNTVAPQQQIAERAVKTVLTATTRDRGVEA